MKFKPKRGAAFELMQQTGVKHMLYNQAARISERAGEGVEPRESQQRGKTRPRAVALTTTAKAINRNRKHNTLVRSMR